jgi:hypothetical protein
VELRGAVAAISAKVSVLLKTPLGSLGGNYRNA